ANLLLRMPPASLGRLRDHCLIIVGDGGEAEEVLAQRRWAAGGRLVHFLVPDEQVRREEGMEEVVFAWQPPCDLKPSSFGRNLGPSFRTYWTTSGPDCVEVAPNQTLYIYGEDTRLVQLVENGRILAEMSGHVIWKPDMTTATSMDVQVEDPELRASGTFSWRYVLSSMALLFLWHVLRWGISIHLEQAAALPGHLGPPWWRGVLVAFNGAVFCVWGLFHTWAASLSGEVGSTGLQKLVPICMAIPPMLPMGTWVQLADFPLSLFGLSILFLFGPTLQYYQTQQQHPARRLLPCLVWTIAQLAGTVGISAILAVIVVAYRLLLVSQPVLASFFLPVCTAVVETGGVMYTKILYAKLVVQKRPMVPGDISWVAMPYMMCSAHAFSEAARLAAVFSGAVSTGDYGWVASLAVTLSLNILVRSGWMRYGCYVLVRKIGGSKRAMWMLAPTAWNKLHDEMKIYAGYFRFIVVLALVAARAVLFQEISLSSSRAAAFNMSAALALIAMLLVEYLEDHIVLRELLPTSPVISEFVEHEVQKASRNSQGCLLSLDLRVTEPGSAWRLDELDADGFRRVHVHRSQSWQNAPGIELGLHVEAVSSNGKTPVPCSTLLPVPGEHLEKAEGFHRASSPASTGRNSELCGPSRSPKRATGGSHQRAESVGSEEDKQRMFSVILPLQCEHAENAEDDECSILAEPAASARSNNSDGREHSQFLHTATVLGLRMESVGSEGGETPKFSAILPLPGEHLEQAEEAEEGELVVAESPVLPRSSREGFIQLNLHPTAQSCDDRPIGSISAPRRVQTLPARVAAPLPEPKLLDFATPMTSQASMGQRRSSLPSRLRRWFGQERQVVPCLLLHGLREMPWFCQLSAIAITCEVALGFLNTTLGPGYIRGVTEACEDFDALVIVWWPTPLLC
ncbi:Uncharacterized protein SCF082_LOCUS39695, partial [Durusdinium trenchii]